MAELLTPGLCVIGGGTGGLPVAIAAAALGVPVVLIEKGELGRARVNAAGLPALRAAAGRAEAFRSSAAFGIKPSRPNIEFYKVNDHVQGVIGAIAPNVTKERLAGLGVRVIEGEGRFRDASTVVVDERFEIKARRFVVATGSTLELPAIPGLDRTRYMTEETILEARERPKHLIILGGNPIALELAQAFRRLGSDVSVIDAAQPLPDEDQECVAVVLDRLAHEGVVVRSGTAIARVKQVRTKVEVTLEDGKGGETIEGSDLLIVAGRRAAVDGHGLDTAGIKYERSGIVVDRRLRTTNKKVYAVGDVTGSAHSVHAAGYHAELVIQNVLLRLPVKLNAATIPRVLLTDPEMAHVGLAEDEARKQAGLIRVLRWPYYENDRAQAGRKTAGHIKVITDKKGKVLGATIVGACASELITAWVLAINQRLNIRVFAGIGVPYPTLSEIGKRAAISFFSPRLTSPWTRVLGWLQRFG